MVTIRGVVWLIEGEEKRKQRREAEMRAWSHMYLLFKKHRTEESRSAGRKRTPQSSS